MTRKAFGAVALSAAAFLVAVVHIAGGSAQRAEALLAGLFVGW